jgi:hypothetical protein
MIENFSVLQYLLELVIQITEFPNNQKRDLRNYRIKLKHMKLINVQNNKRHDGRLKEYETNITLFQTLVIIQFSCQLLMRQSVIFELLNNVHYSDCNYLFCFMIPLRGVKDHGLSADVLFSRKPRRKHSSFT